MATKLFVGSLPYSVNDQQLQDIFAEAGTVVSAKVIIDRDSNRSKGFGFVEMGSEEETKKAIEMFNNKEVEGRTITVNEARPQEPRGPRGNGGGGYNNNRSDRYDRNRGDNNSNRW
ncbi:MAG TPA: RNA-binding protein [Candidatus Saccharimonadales bacterium]|nr:RNA-binding protein [Candidatus Saccharimonadales bacterium]